MKVNTHTHRRKRARNSLAHPLSSSRNCATILPRLDPVPIRARPAETERHTHAHLCLCVWRERRASGGLPAARGRTLRLFDIDNRERIGVWVAGAIVTDRSDCTMSCAYTAKRPGRAGSPCVLYMWLFHAKRLGLCYFAIFARNLFKYYINISHWITAIFFFDWEYRQRWFDNMIVVYNNISYFHKVFRISRNIGNRLRNIEEFISQCDFSIMVIKNS